MTAAIERVGMSTGLASWGFVDPHGSGRQSLSPRRPEPGDSRSTAPLHDSGRKPEAGKVAYVSLSRIRRTIRPWPLPKPRSRRSPREREPTGQAGLLLLTCRPDGADRRFVAKAIRDRRARPVGAVPPLAVERRPQGAAAGHLEMAVRVGLPHP